MKVAFIFPGQGTQFVGMGLDFYERYQYVRDIYKTAELLTGYQITNISFDGTKDQLSEARFCQLAVYVMSVVCLEVFKREIGFVKPSFVAGLSLGELTALYASGVLDFESDTKLIKKRADLMHEICESMRGKMVCAIGGSIEDIEDICKKTGVEIANINSKNQIVISGTEDAIDETTKKLKDINIKRIIPIDVAGAYHSRFMNGAKDKLSKYIDDEKIGFNNAVIPVVQNVVGESVVEGMKIKENIINQISGTVKWLQCVEYMINSGIDLIIEFGPGKVLTNLIRGMNVNIKLFNINSVDSIDFVKNNISK